MTSLIDDDAEPASREPDRRRSAPTPSSTPSRWSPAARWCAGRFSLGTTSPARRSRSAASRCSTARATPTRRSSVEHAAPRGESREYYRHIVADEATGVYQGKVIVAPHAQKTDGGMKSQAILLSPTATMNNKPELEIFADDVVCGHGATVGALDPEQIFYLQARGMPRAEAEAMLLEAFGAEAIDASRIPSSPRRCASACARGSARG